MKKYLLALSTFSLALFLFSAKATASELSDEQVKELESKGYTSDLIEMYLENGYDFERLNGMEVIGDDEVFLKVVEHFPAGYEEEEEGFSTNSYDEFSYDDNDFYSDVEEISYEEYLQGVQQAEFESELDDKFSTYASHRTSTSYKTMRTVLTKINKNKFQVTNNVRWNKNPKHRKNDIIGVSINSNTSPIKGTEWARQTWGTLSGHKKGSATYTTKSNKWQRSGGGYGLYFKLKGGRASDGSPWRYMTMYMEYQIKPNVSNLVTVDAFGDYRHQQKSTNITPSFSIGSDGVGISISASQNKYYSKHPNTHVQVKR